MKRSQRTVHAAVWPTLAVGMLVILALALIARESASPPPQTVPTEVAR
jgi:hypothetical protein